MADEIQPRLLWDELKPQIYTQVGESRSHRAEVAGCELPATVTIHVTDASKLKWRTKTTDDYKRNRVTVMAN